MNVHTQKEIDMARRRRKGKHVFSTTPWRKITRAQHEMLKKCGTVDIFISRVNEDIGAGNDIDLILEESDTVIRGRIERIDRGDVFNTVIIALRK